MFEETKGGGGQEAVDGYLYLNNIIRLQPRDWGGNLEYIYDAAYKMDHISFVSG